MKYYNTTKIDKHNARYNIIYGERSNGKTYAVLEKSLKNYIETGGQFAYLRRWDEDIKQGQLEELFSAFNGEKILNMTLYKWDRITVRARKFYFAKFDEQTETLVLDAEPCGFAFALSRMEHYKSVSYPKITLICFDEFITRTTYYPEEFVIFCNMLSTIIRQRDDVKIYMLGNTVNKYCPYFAEMGLKHIKEMHPGDIDIYTYGDSGLKVAVEYTLPNAKGKKSDIYFAFDNPKLNMITNGAWEMEIYPHCPMTFEKKDIKFIYFIIFDGQVLQCEIVRKGKATFTFIHQKTTPLQNPEKDLIYSFETKPLPNWRKNILKPGLPVEKKIATFFAVGKVFYQDNETGEIVRNYLLNCKKA